MRFVLFAALALASFSAAADGNEKLPFKSLDVAAITAQQKQIQQDIIAQRGPYKDLPDTQRVELLSRQATLLRMVDGKASLDELSRDQQAEVFNTLEWMEVAINQDSDDERMVCRREKPLGSTRTTRVCRTVAEERAAKERAREDFENLNTSNR